MLYNDLITYNQTNITYTGIIQINVPGISNPIIINNITVVISVEEDFSNATTIGYVTFDYVPNGIITIEATQDQAEALVSASTIYINYGIITIEATQDQAEALVSASTIYINSNSGEVSIESV